MNLCVYSIQNTSISEFSKFLTCILVVYSTRIYRIIWKWSRFNKKSAPKYLYLIVFGIKRRQISIHLLVCLLCVYRSNWQAKKENTLQYFFQQRPDYKPFKRFIILTSKVAFYYITEQKQTPISFLYHIVCYFQFL